MDYKKLLKKVRSELPDVVLTKERFEIPKVRGHIQGNKTIISNFFQIANLIGRDVNHMLKYLFKELAAYGETRNNLLILGRKISASNINEKIKKYVNEFVLCNECGKPDTKLEKQGNVSIMRCLACGARKPVKTVL